MTANLRSVFLCTQAAARQMIAQASGGAIVNITSIEAENPAPNHSHYNASKGGVLMYTRAAANELGRHGIRVNAVAPGLIWKDDIEQSVAGWRGALAASGPAATPGHARGCRRRLPFPRLARRALDHRREPDGGWRRHDPSDLLMHEFAY